MALTADPGSVSPLMNVLRERWVLTLATVPGPDEPAPDRHVPYPTPLFYAVADLPERPGEPFIGPQLVFASKPESTHGRHLGAGPTAVAAGIYLETESVGELRGVQLRGQVVRLTAEAPAAAVVRAAYLGRASQAFQVSSALPAVA